MRKVFRKQVCGIFLSKSFFWAIVIVELQNLDVDFNNTVVDVDQEEAITAP